MYDSIQQTVPTNCMDCTRSYALVLRHAGHLMHAKAHNFVDQNTKIIVHVIHKLSLGFLQFFSLFFSQI